MLSTDGNSFLTAYLEANKKLVQTLVVKSNMAVMLVNESITKTYGSDKVDPYDPGSWKYYLNLAGKRHFSDDLINVISLDTQEVIEFTPENLKLHLATKAAYQFGSRYYYSLLRQYPQQEALIRGVITPVDINTCVGAADGSILTYQLDLVQEQEVTLIEDLQEFIQMFLYRWHVPGYQTSDPYYSLVQFYILGSHLLGRLLNLRQARCHTNEAHSFHIREFLASNGRLDRFMPYLTTEQMLYLYRNVRYLRQHSGSAAQFQELLDKILVKRNIPLAEYSISQLNILDDNGYNQILAKRRPLTSDANASDVQYVEMAELYRKERKVIAGNADYLDLHQEQELHRFRLAASSVTQTKVLESAMVDYTDAVPDTKPEVFVRQWAYMAFNNLFPVSVYFTDPVSGEYRGMSAKDAFIYMTYLSLGSYGIFTETLPRFSLVKFRLDPKPSLAYLQEHIPSALLQLRDTVKNIWLRQPVLKQCRSVQEFNTVATAIYDESLYHWTTLSNTHELYRHGYLKMAIGKLYGMQWVDPGAETMVAWLKRTGVPKYGYSADQAGSLIAVIFNAVTGYSINNSGQLRYVQKHLLELFAQLSSYTVLFLADGNSSAVLPLGWSSIRVSDARGVSSGHGYAFSNAQVLDHYSSGGDRLAISTAMHASATPVHLHASDRLKLKSSVDLLGTKSTISFNGRLSVGSVLLDARYADQDPAISANSGAIGAEYFYRLTEEQKARIKIR